MPSDNQQSCPAADTCPLITRRDFIVKGSAALAALAVLGACGSSTAPLRSTLTVQLADHPELADVGSITRVFAQGSPVGIARLGLADFAAYSLVCPHEGVTIGVDASREDFVCPGHGATFDDTGTWIGGQHTRNLTTYTTTFDASTGTITVMP